MHCVKGGLIIITKAQCLKHFPDKYQPTSKLCAQTQHQPCYKFFNEVIITPQHKYSATFSSNNLYIKSYFLNCTDFSNSLHRLKFWNDVLDIEGKQHLS